MADEVFDAEWLRLREPVDHRSRARALVSLLRREGCRRGWSRVVDLGAGTGSNVRFLAARIPWARRWAVVDHDPGLLERIHEPGPDRTLRRVVGDLADEGLDAVDGADLVTASALLDLVSRPWLEALCRRCAEDGAAAYFALSYDGRVVWEAPDGDDAFVLDAVNRHQRKDKGLGGALGPEASDVAEALFREAGYRTWSRPSPWRLAAPDDTALAHRLVDGWVEAALETEPSAEARIRRWASRRRDDIAIGRTDLQVGHLDLLALPPEGGAEPLEGGESGTTESLKESESGAARSLEGPEAGTGPTPSS
jgi:SAM-dependent methyltransferase